MNVLKADKKSTIITLHKNGLSQNEIHKKTKIDRKTIRKYIKENLGSKSPTQDEVATGSKLEENSDTPQKPLAEKQVPDKLESPKQARSACEPHREWIEEQVRLGRNAVSIYQDLVERYHFIHKYNSVKRFVRVLKKKDPKQFDRLEFPPGEETQVDYGLGAKTKDDSGKYRRPRLFVMTLKYSGRSFRKVVWKSSKKVWAKLHEEGFRYFGGCPQYVVLDNLKEGVLKPDIYEPELNPVYEAMLLHYGVIADTARVRDPNRKGTVESAVKHTQETALKGRTFETIEGQNEWLIHWEEKWAAPRIHGRAKRQVEEMFQEEKPYFQKLPLFSFQYFEQETRTVWDDGTIQIGKSYYSALPAPLYQKVIARIYDFEIEIINPKTMEIIRRHRRSFRAGAVRMEEKDRIFNPSRQTKYLFTKAEKIGPETKKLCELLFQDQGRPGQRRLQGIVNLARRYKACHIEEAAEKAINANLHNYQSIKKLVQGIAEKGEQKKSEDSLIQDHALIRAPEDYATFFDQYAAQSEADIKAPTITNFKSDYVMTRDQMRETWQNAKWEKVIEVFGLEVTRRGKANEIWIKSPFSNEKTASLHLDLERNIFKDFSSGMGAGVGILNFCQEMLQQQGRKLNCYEVAVWMVDNGISSQNALHKNSKKRDEKEKSRSLKRNKPIKIDLRHWMHTDHPYLQRRQVSKITCDYLGCGFLPEREKSQSPLNGRIVFQIRGVKMEGTGLTPIILSHIGRALTTEQKETNGKYWSFPFHKSLEIYNQDKLLTDPVAIRQLETSGLILVEGFFDVAVLIEAGVLNVGGLMGAQITSRQVERLQFIHSKVKFPKIKVFLDRDETGNNGAQKTLSILHNKGFMAEVFDWDQTFTRPDATLANIPSGVKDAGDMTVKQLQWLQRQKRI
jgi:transposase